MQVNWSRKLAWAACTKWAKADGLPAALRPSILVIVSPSGSILAWNVNVGARWTWELSLLRVNGETGIQAPTWVFISEPDRKMLESGTMLKNVFIC